MALIYRNAKGQLGNTPGALLTAETNQTIIIRSISLFNGSGGSVADTSLYVYPSGGSAGNATEFFYEGSMLSKKGASPNLKDNLHSGDVLAGEAASASAINYIISYAVITD